MSPTFGIYSENTGLHGVLMSHGMKPLVFPRPTKAKND